MSNISDELKLDLEIYSQLMDFADRLSSFSHFEFLWDFRKQLLEKGFDTDVVKRYDYENLLDGCIKDGSLVKLTVKTKDKSYPIYFAEGTSFEF